MKSVFHVCVAVGVASSVAIADDRPLDQIIDESIGYVNIADGVILIEDSSSSSICKVDIPDVVWDSAKVGRVTQEAVDATQIICVPSPLLSQIAQGRTPKSQPFDEIVDQSIGYETISEKVVMIEDSESSKICRVDIPDAFFVAYAAEDAAGMNNAFPEIICINTPDLNP